MVVKCGIQLTFLNQLKDTLEPITYGITNVKPDTIFEYTLTAAIVENGVIMVLFFVIFRA